MLPACGYKSYATWGLLATGLFDYEFSKGAAGIGALDEGPRSVHVLRARLQGGVLTLGAGRFQSQHCKTNVLCVGS